MKHFIVVFLGLIASPMFACSDIALPKAEGQPVVSAREMDFNCTMWSEFIVSPRGFKYTGYTPNSRKGMTWENKYGFIAINFVNIPVLKLISKELYCDGMNETGLSAGLLWLESSKTPNPSNEIASKTMCQLNVVAWVLGRCSTVKEVLDVFDKENPDIMYGCWNLLECCRHHCTWWCMTPRATVQPSNGSARRRSDRS